MTSKYLLVISKDYWGTQTSENIAKKFSQNFSELIDIPPRHITELIGNDVTLNKVKDTIYSFVQTSLSDNSHYPRLYIYINGHGNQTVDSNGDEIDGQDELYQLPDGNLTDDTLTQLIDSAFFYSNSFNRPFVCLISDHCSSGSMIDKTQRFFDWVTIGSSLDNQDSFVSGDGNVMTVCLLNVLDGYKNKLKDLTTNQLYDLLNSEMKNSFIGDLQQCTLNMSDSSMSSFHLFE
jgi:hypothetical protein